MDIKTIHEKYRNGDYNSHIKYGNKVASDYVFDEELSVRRNREMVEEHNAKCDSQRKEAYAKQAELDKKLAHDVCCYITEYYDLTYEVASKIERFCYEQKHDDMYAYFDYIETITDFVDGIVNPD